MRQIEVSKTAEGFAAEVDGKTISATNFSTLKKFVALHLGEWDESNLKFNLV